MDDLSRLALAAADGDRAALAAFVRATQADVWRLCAAVASRSEADDLTQDVYVRAIPALQRYRGDAPARAWLLTIARRTCIDHIRRAGRRRRAGERWRSRAEAREVTAPPPSSAGADYDDLLAAIDPSRREAFLLTQVIGLSYQDAAEVCGVPVGTIRSRVSRARADLAALLDEPSQERDAR